MTRNAILGQIRAALGVKQGDMKRAPHVATRLGAPAPPGPIPAIARAEGAARVRRFLDMAVRGGATVDRLNLTRQIPSAVAGQLRKRELPLEIRVGDDPFLAALDWERARVSVSRGSGREVERAAASFAFAGIAETGLVAFVSGKDNPTSLNFLAEFQIVILRPDRICASYEALFARVRAAGFQGRAINLIGGPSRSGDVEQTLALGAHGPRAVHVILPLDEGPI